MEEELNPGLSGNIERVERPTFNVQLSTFNFQRRIKEMLKTEGIRSRYDANKW